MTPLPRASMPLLVALVLAGPLCAAAPAGEAESLHGAWRDCLSRNFALQATLTGRELAADAAFRACCGAEETYLSALAAAPLLDADDVARARPALAGRIRAWLVGG